MAIRQRKTPDVSHETPTLTENQRIVELVEKLHSERPAALPADEYPELSAVQLQLLAWQMHTWQYEIPVTIICQLAGCSRTTFYDANRNAKYLGYLARDCRRLIGSKTVAATREYLRLGLREGDRLVLERLLETSGTLPAPRKVFVTDDSDNIDEPMTDEEEHIAAQGYEALLHQSRQQETQTDKRDSVDGAEAPPNAQKSDS